MMFYEFTVYRYSQDLTLPFELKFLMPATDRGRRGYSDEYADRLAKLLD